MIGISHRSLSRIGPLERILEDARTLGFVGVVPLAGADRAARPDRVWYRERGLAVWAVALDHDPTSPHLAEPAHGPRARAARERVMVAARHAAALGCPVIRVEAAAISIPGVDALAASAARGDAAALAALAEKRRGGRDHALDALCRNLHALLLALPDHTIALAPRADPLAMPLPGELDWIREEVGSPRLAWWYAPDRLTWLERLGLGAAESWLPPDRSRVAGVTFADVGDDGPGQLPGSGRLDWREISGELPARAPLVLETDGELSKLELVMAYEFGKSLGR